MKMKKIYHEQNDNINIYVKYGNSIVTKQEETISVPDKKKSMAERRGVSQFSNLYFLTMIDLILHAVLHDQKNYHLFRIRIKILIKLCVKMKSRGAEHFEINIECMLYIMYAVDYIHTKP